MAAAALATGECGSASEHEWRGEVKCVAGTAVVLRQGDRTTLLRARVARK
jgi:hypothetical protein